MSCVAFSKEEVFIFSSKEGLMSRGTQCDLWGDPVGTGHKKISRGDTPRLIFCALIPFIPRFYESLIFEELYIFSILQKWPYRMTVRPVVCVSTNFHPVYFSWFTTSAFEILNLLLRAKRDISAVQRQSGFFHRSHENGD